MATGENQNEGVSPEVASPTGASIRVVVNRTGIAADTLRVWERRYGFPNPPRRPGGSRVYSEADVARLRLIARAVAAGFRPSEVVPLAVEDLARLVEAAAADVTVAGQIAPASPVSPMGVSTANERLAGAVPTIDAAIAALLDDDVVRLRGALRAAAVALGPRLFVSEFAHPLAIEIGTLWEKGGIEVRHEHLASACLTNQLHLLLGALEHADRSPTVLLATPPHDQHLLGIDMVAVYLASNLAEPRMLGADTPPDQILDTARVLAVDAVGLSIAPSNDHKAMLENAAWLAERLLPKIELWLGGAGAASVAAAIPAATHIPTWADLDRALIALRLKLHRLANERPSPQGYDTRARR